MIFQYELIRELKIETLADLEKLKLVVEVNNLKRPNFSELGRTLGYDRRTVKKYYEGRHKKKRKPKISKLKEYDEIINTLLFSKEEGKSSQKFRYKSHLYRYLVREHNLKCSRSNLNYYILKHDKFSKYFKNKEEPDSVKTETPFGKQGQFDWKEKIKFDLKTGEKIIYYVASLILGSSRYKIWDSYLSTNQECLFDFLTRAFEFLGGVPKEIWIDNATTMMTKARTEISEGVVNARFAQFAKDFGFEIKPCIRARAKTKAKVENPMRIIDEIMNYNGVLQNMEEIQEKLKIINDEANSRICQTTGLPPIFLLPKEKEHLLPLPNNKICSFYKTTFRTVTLNSNGLFEYDSRLYSASPELIGKPIQVKKIENQLYVYYNKKLVTMHRISNKKINYLPEHHFQMYRKTFPKKENIEEFAAQHLKELEKFNEQLSKVM